MFEDPDLNPGPAVMIERARSIASLFDLPDPIEAFDFTGKGNINQQTYLIKAGSADGRAEYLLQLLNPAVFSQPHVVMDAMIACIEAQQKALSKGMLPKDEEWEAPRLIPTKRGDPYLEVIDKERPMCWRMIVRIRPANTYKSLSEIPDPKARLQLAEEAGRGLALFGILTSGMDASQLSCALPGYRDTRLYYDQLVSVLAGNRTHLEAAAYLPSDPDVRQSTAQHFLIHIGLEEYRRRLEGPQLGKLIDLALEQKPFALTLVTRLMAGNLKKVVVHGDTKLENFLFSPSTGKVKALIDLDTIMPHTWLTDWGDMARSLVNVAGERETNPARIEVDLEVLKALARGFWGSARHIDVRETQLMVDAAQIMALELGVRFLADYLRGDSYFRLEPEDPRDLNKIRALVQFCVFENLRKNAPSAKRYIEELTRNHEAP